jgi:hypothetical protein
MFRATVERLWGVLWTAVKNALETSIMAGDEPSRATIFDRKMAHLHWPRMPFEGLMVMVYAMTSPSSRQMPTADRSPSEGCTSA